MSKCNKNAGYAKPCEEIGWIHFRCEGKSPETLRALPEGLTDFDNGKADVVREVA